MTESDGTVAPMFPQEARLRNLTYSASLYVDLSKKIETCGADEDPIEADWQPLHADEGDTDAPEDLKIFIGKVSDCSTSTSLTADSCHAPE